MEQMENEKFLTEQIITYIGNKRSLLDFIGEAVHLVQDELDQNKLDVIDIFSGSGIVARYLKKYSRRLITNDLEDYSYVLNKCYLSNQEEMDMAELDDYYNRLKGKLAEGLAGGFISELYAPKDSGKIEKGERVFFTTRNAQYIDTSRQIISGFPFEIQPYFIAPLLTEASVKNNTGGVFKGFYKNKKTGIGQFGGLAGNALSRITSDIELLFPIFSNFTSEVVNYQQDANILVSNLDHADLMYIDPPYNQHPYGSNYFMLNLINRYEKPDEISNVSGIPTDWNRSKYNKKKESFAALSELCRRANVKYLLISYNSEGFVQFAEMEKMLKAIGSVTILQKKYNTYRASRNLMNRDPYVYEYLFLVKKN